VDAITESRTVKPRVAGRSRTALNFWIDLATGFAFAVLLGTASLMKWILPPGTCDEAGVKTWLGHSRHWWGDIHFWVAMLMLALIVLHIWLHWSWVVGTWGKLMGSLRSPLTWVALGLMAGFIAVPWLVPAQYLDVEVTEQAAVPAGLATDEPAAETATAVAPCGVEGLSCSDCPAADDRLFGGGCSTDVDAEADDTTKTEEPAPITE